MTKLLKLIDRIVFGVLIRIIGRLHFRFTKGPAFTRVHRERLKNILFIRPGGLGDLLLLLPAVQRVRASLPNSTITLVCEKRNRQAAQLSNLFDRILVYDANPVRFLWELRRGVFDAAVDAEQFHNASCFFSWMSGAMVRIGFKIKPSRNELYTHLIDYPMDRHESEVFDMLVHPLVGPPDKPLELVGLLDRSHFASGEKEKAKLSSVGWPEKKVVALFAHASIPEKQWSVAKHLKLIKRLTEQMDMSIAIIGGDDGRDVAQMLLAGSDPARVVSLVGETDFIQTAALLSVCALFIGGDTGTGHLARALDVPSVVLYGPSDQRKWGVNTDRHASVFVTIPCRPCSIFGYVKLCRTIDCMELISVDDVMKAAKKVASH